MDHERGAVRVEQAGHRRAREVMPIVPRPSVPMIRLGRSPSCGPCGFMLPCFMPVGFQWPPAVVKSGASQRPAVWMCAPCVPGGIALASSVKRRPPATSVAVARPTSMPVAVLEHRGGALAAGHRAYRCPCRVLSQAVSAHRRRAEQCQCRNPHVSLPVDFLRTRRRGQVPPRRKRPARDRFVASRHRGRDGSGTARDGVAGRARWRARHGSPASRRSRATPRADRASRATRDVREIGAAFGRRPARTHAWSTLRWSAASASCGATPAQSVSVRPRFSKRPTPASATLGAGATIWLSATATSSATAAARPRR